MFYTKKEEAVVYRKICHQFTIDFEQQFVDLHAAGQKCSESIKEYDSSPSSFNKWVRQAKLTGSFKMIVPPYDKVKNETLIPNLLARTFDPKSLGNYCDGLGLCSIWTNVK